jgi:NAD(P)-dependent dehydrogenase (short-subunit alcohol dehydrogenase family)
MSFPVIFKVDIFLTVYRIALSLYYWIVSFFLFNCIKSIFSILFFKRTVDPEGKGVLVTGCDSGFGHSLVKKLDKLGYHVFATVLSTESNGAKDLMKNCSNRVLTVQMNVTNMVEVVNVVDMIRRSDIPLWSVVNNAGIARSSFVEWADDVDEFEKTFAVNVFGLVRVTKACLPLLRRTKGRVINMASTCGKFS